MMAQHLITTIYPMLINPGYTPMKLINLMKQSYQMRLFIHAMTKTTLIPFFFDDEVQSDTIDFADIPEHVRVIHAIISWLHLLLHLSCTACNMLLAIFSSLLLFLCPTTPVPFTTLKSDNHLLGVNKPIHMLPVCPTCCDIYPMATSLLCHDTCTSCNVDLFLPSQTLQGNNHGMKTPTIKYPYLPLSEQITSILKIPGIDKWRKKLCTLGTCMDIFNGAICCTKLKGQDSRLFCSNNMNEQHGPNGKLPWI